MIAICVGHSRPGDTGAVSAGGISERAYNNGLAKVLKAQLEDAGHECAVIDTYLGNDYTTAMRWLGRKLTTIKATAAIELHFSAGDADANGHEWLHWHDSQNGRLLARALERNMARMFPTAKKRGCVSRYPRDRGGEFLRATPCPAVICEPFFGTNEAEWHRYSPDRGKLAAALCAGISDWIGGAA